MTFAFSYKHNFELLGMLFYFFFLFILNQHNPDVISNQIRAKRKEKKNKVLQTPKSEHPRSSYIPFSEHGGLCDRCVLTTDAFNSAPAKPTALTTPGFPFFAAFTFLQKSLFFDKTEASHSHKMHKKTRQIQRHNRYCTN